MFATHSETSTGTVHDLEAIAKVTRPRDAMLIVDAITSVGVHPLPQDAGASTSSCADRRRG